jgi:hypothetical protein
LAGRAVETLADGRVKIEGVAPMSATEAMAYLVRRAGDPALSELNAIRAFFGYPSIDYLAPT